MRKTAALLTSSLLAGAAIVTVGAAGAYANTTPTCVTKDEFAAVTNGMTRDRVHAIFGIDGKQTMLTRSNGHVYMMRQYKPCLPASYVSVQYTDGKVTSKTAHWG